MKQDREVWERAIALVESGSATRAAVAAKLGVSESAVTYWVGKLRREGESERKAEFLPVRVTGQQLSVIEIRMGDLVVSVRYGTDVDYVAGLVRALRSC